MALTKLPKNAIADGAIDASKIEDGTIQNVELEDGTLTSEKLATGTIANASLSNSSITINGSSVSLGGTINLGTAFIADVNWQSVQTTGFTAVAGNGYFVNTTSGAITVTLPASASIGDTIAIKDYAGTFASNNLTIGRNGHNIQGVANDSLISTNRASLVLVYVDSTKGWIYAEESNVADLRAPVFISATGGTITTSGDYKIHTFTGDGCFVVSQIGNAPTVPTGGPQTISYLVVAGGGGGGINSGGGGAGGFREGRDIGPSYTASPLVSPTGLTITNTTYPITVGGGGSSLSVSPDGVPCGGCGTAPAGSISVFSTITSAGGGGGGGGNKDPINPVVNGGSGGGGGNTGGPNIVGGSGNTPPVSPPQGNPGGTGAGSQGSGAGGGAGGAGASQPGSSPYPSTNGTAGGVGVSTSISGSSLSYSGGGSGGGYGSPSSTAGSPCGTGGGAGNDPSPSKCGTANRGGGGGGRTPAGPTTSDSPTGAGGKGIVIIRYKFQ